MNPSLPLHLRLPALADTALVHLWACLSSNAGSVWIRAARRARNGPEALSRVRLAARAGHPAGHYELGLAHWEGLLPSTGEGSSPGEAVAAFLLAADGGHAAAMMMLGEATMRGLGVVRNVPKAMDWFSRAARSGNLRAARSLAQAFEKGDGVTPDVVKALVWRELCGAGPVPDLPRSCVASLGMLQNLDPVEPPDPDFQGGPSFLQRLPERLGATAIFAVLGLMAAIGLLVLGINILGFIKWFQTGSVVFAISALPILILPAVGFAIALLVRGKGIDRRARRASSRLLKFANAGDREACFRLGLAFQDGDAEHPKDHDSARRWLRRSAELGHPEAAVRLAQMMRWGAGGPKDLDSATAWLRSAAASGNTEAARLLKQNAPVRTAAASDLLGAWSAPLNQATG